MDSSFFIQNKLENLKCQSNIISDKQELLDFIYKTISSKKFRKFSLNHEYQEYIKKAIVDSLGEDKPIFFSFPFGGYKLWRFDESPEVDWAELFALIYYVKWLKPICEVYKPGVVFDFASDDIIVERMNNISKEETGAYRNSFLDLVKFLETYIPENFKITFTPISSFYKEDEFELDLIDKIEKKKVEFNGLPKLDDKQKNMIKLNVRLKEDQDNDLEWMEKTELIHQAYYTVDKRRPYNRAHGKIIVFPYQLKDGKCIAPGTTKTSVAKFWVGLGVLKRKGESYLEYVFSPSQINNTKFDFEDVKINGLSGKNFSKIRIF